MTNEWGGGGAEPFAYDPHTRQYYALNPATGRYYAVDPRTGQPLPVTDGYMQQPVGYTQNPQQFAPMQQQAGHNPAGFDTAQQALYAQAHPQQSGYFATASGSRLYAPPPRKNRASVLFATVLSVVAVAAVIVTTVLVVQAVTNGSSPEASPPEHANESIGTGGIDGIPFSGQSGDDYPLGAPAVAPGAFDDLNDWASDFDPDLDSDGTYKQAAEELAAAYGKTIIWDYEEMNNHCDRSTYVPSDSVIASVCWPAYYALFVNVESNLYDSWIQSEFSLDTVRHEISHIQIVALCGSPVPDLIEGQHEAVTESYSVLFLGADRGRHGWIQKGEYKTTDESDRLAELIHDGVCE